MSNFDVAGLLASSRQGAVISDDGVYRYLLWRRWVGVGWTPVVWVLLNPSTADEAEDDATIRRCIGFSRRWGFGGIVVVNLYALRSTDPAELDRARAPGGPDNVGWLQAAMNTDLAVARVAGWGNGRPRYLARPYVEGFGGPMVCLGTTKAVNPRHPLRVAYSQGLEWWSGPAKGDPVSEAVAFDDRRWLAARRWREGVG